MDTNRMRLGLMYIFSENKTLNKSSKLQIVSFIENATDLQLQALALDGEIVSSKLDKVSENLLRDRFKVSESLRKKIGLASTLALKSISK